MNCLLVDSYFEYIISFNDYCVYARLIQSCRIIFDIVSKKTRIIINFFH